MRDEAFAKIFLFVTGLVLGALFGGVFGEERRDLVAIVFQWVSKSSAAEWLVALATIGAVVVALRVAWVGRKDAYKARQDQMDEDQRKREKEKQNLLRALYVEAYHRAARVTADMKTFHDMLAEIERRLGRQRSIVAPIPSQNRTKRNILKFMPISADVYRQLGQRMGSLPPDIQVPLAMFYFRLEMVAMDIQRIAGGGEDDRISDQASLQVARRFWDCCQPAIDTLDAFEKAIEDSQALTKELDESMEAFRYPLYGKTVRESLKGHIANGNPTVKGVAAYLA